MLDARFSHLYSCQSLPTPQRGLSAVADLLVSITLSHFYRQTNSDSPNSKESSRVIDKQPLLKFTAQSHQI